MTPIDRMPYSLGYVSTAFIWSFYHRICEDRPDDHKTHAYMLKLLQDQLRTDVLAEGSLLSEVATMAVKMRMKSLYQHAVCASLRDAANRALMLTTIARLIKESHLENPQKPPDWDFWYIPPHHTLIPLFLTSM